MAWHQAGVKPLYEAIMTQFIHIILTGLVQEKRNSSVLAMEFRLSCINPLIYASQGLNVLNQFYLILQLLTHWPLGDLNKILDK